MLDAVLFGAVIEEYEDQRCLFCGKVRLENDVAVYLHVICEYADLMYVEFITAYVPDPGDWENPPLKRRHQ